jgi:hypothetical protein
LGIVHFRPLAAVVLFAFCLTGCRGNGASGFFQQYEYEEEIYLSLDGSATLYVNASVPALNALRGSTFDTRPNGRIDRTAVRQYFSSPMSTVERVSLSRRSNRRFVHVRLDVPDVRRLHEAQPFAWSSYRFGPDGNLVTFSQRIGASFGGTLGSGQWTGREVVAFRVHVPSKVAYHNAGADNLRRGNIVVWEQPLTERLGGSPLALDLRMEPQSILYRTLLLFGATGLVVVALFAAVIWWVRGRGVTPTSPGSGVPA